MNDERQKLNAKAFQQGFLLEVHLDHCLLTKSCDANKDPRNCIRFSSLQSVKAWLESENE